MNECFGAVILGEPRWISHCSIFANIIAQYHNTDPRSFGFCAGEKYGIIVTWKRSDFMLQMIPVNEYRKGIRNVLSGIVTCYRGGFLHE